MSSNEPKFACPSCGKQYRWKPELAGRSAKCPCGAKVVVPQTMAAASAPAPTPEPAKRANACPSCGKSLEAGAVLCIACGYNLKTGQKLSLVVEQDADDDEEEAESVPAKNSG